MPYSSARPIGARPRLLVGHTGEGILRLSDMVRYLDNNPYASAHAVSAAEGLSPDLVPDERAAWTAGPTGNSYGLHIEQCAFALMTREQWLSEQDVNVFVPWLGARGEWRLIRSPMSMLRHTARWLRAKSDRWGIPLVKLSAADVRAGKSGVCSHADISLAWGETDHTDPGNGYPWDVVLALARGDAASPSRKDLPEVNFLVRLKTGEYATQDGPFVSGIDKTTARATIAKWGGSETGCSEAEWADRVAKSRSLETLGAKVDNLTATMQQLVTLLSQKAGS